MKQSLKLFVSFILLIAMTINFTACNNITKVEATDLLNGIRAVNVADRPFDVTYINSYADFSLKLFKKSITENESSLISPLSVMLALAMTANGADGQTKAEMEELLGGNIKLNDLNEYLYALVKNMPSNEKNKLKISNSIWFKDADQFSVNKDFLQTNANYYNVVVYKSAFDSQTVKDINNWVNENTDGMIDKILEQINENEIMYLINAVAFEAEWDTIYEKDDISADIFTAINNEKRYTEFMYSEEEIYIETKEAKGFVKPYKDKKYSFVALLPNEDVDINKYIESLDGKEFMNAVSNTETTEVITRLPKFSSEYTKEMKGVLSSLGIPTAFNEALADFSKIGKSSNGNIFIGSVLHKTYISVDEKGTKAAAVTDIAAVESAETYVKKKYVILNRPFIYAIVDNRTKLPIFIGTVMDVYN